ncbi:MAG: class I SAM-dependent methyltransferase [Candidatus Eisenbacteria bacterium]
MTTHRGEGVDSGAGSSSAGAGAEASGGEVFRPGPRNMDEEERARRRIVFDGVADIYERARPAYPDALITDLIETCAIGRSSRVLEIGCGPGLLTLPLARTGAHIVAVELGANLAARAERLLAEFPAVHVCVADFDRWEPPPEPFDVVVAATAFHWLDPAHRVVRCGRALHPGGTLAVVDTYWGVGATPGGFETDVQECYARWHPRRDPNFTLRTLRDLPSARSDLEAGDLGGAPELRRYSVTRQYSSEQYRGLVQTFSDILRLDPDHRAGFVECVGRLIEERFGGSIDRTDTYDLWTVRKAVGGSDD